MSSKKKDITSYLKHYGFLILNAEIYQGFKSWDLGSYGTELKRNLKNLWWKYFITTSPYNVGSDSCLITHRRVLEASGHLKNFHDWLVECRTCQKRYRLDNLLDDTELSTFLTLPTQENYQVEKTCPHCQTSNFASPRQFNLLLSTNLEVTENKEQVAYLRPETCQGIFTNFLAIQRSTHRKLPFGVGQIGKSFRNEITLHHGIFRTREFEQMELEFFCREEESEKWWAVWTEKSWSFLNKVVVNHEASIKKVDLKKEDLPHYSKKTLDLYFNYHFGWGELCSNSHRGNYDLSQHSQQSQEFLGVKENGEEIIPTVIEVSFGVERLMLAILEDAYQEEIIDKTTDDSQLVNNSQLTGANSPQLTREVLRLHPLLSPYFVAIIPLSKQLKPLAYQLYLDLLILLPFNITWEESSSVGKSYRRQDAIGTYYCLTIDFQTPQDQTITCRYRDSMNQKRIAINSLKNYLKEDYEKHQEEFTNQ